MNTKKTILIISILMIVVIFLLSCALDNSERITGLYTEGRWIKNNKERVIHLKGVAQNELFEESLIESWYRHHQIPSQYDKIKSLGCNIVRVMINKVYWDQDISIKSIDEKVSNYRDVLKNVVDMCFARNMYVLISLDGPDRTNYLLNPETSGWLITLRELTTTYKEYSNVIIDPMNEPARAGENQDEHITIWRDAVIHAIEAIRAIAPDMVLLIQPSAGTYNAVKEFSNAYGKGHLPYPNIIYGGHHYFYSDSIWDHPWVAVYREGRFEDAKNFRSPSEYQWDVDEPLTLMEHLYYGKIGVLSDEDVPVMIDEFGARIDRTIHYDGTYLDGEWLTDFSDTKNFSSGFQTIVLDGPFSWYTELIDFYYVMNKNQWSFIQFAWRAEYRTDANMVYNTMLHSDWITLNELGNLFKNYAFTESLVITGQVFNPDGTPYVGCTVSSNGEKSVTDVNGRYVLVLTSQEQDFIVKFTNGHQDSVILDSITSHLYIFHARAH
ncbi:MAG: glycoside hydrolase family 5 protein [Candidatus Hodarchaeota archaeon]